MSNGYWQKYQSERLNRRRVLQAAGFSGAGLAAALIFGCGGSSSDSAGSAASPATKDEVVDLAANQMLRDRFNNDLLALDPARIFGIEQEATATGVYSGLTMYDADMKLTPDLAKSWETPDPLTYIFHLNPAKWQKGYGDVTAEDVAFSYNRVINGKGSYAWEFNLIDKITATDAQTVTVKLKKPFYSFLHTVSNYHQGAILSKSAVEKVGDAIWLDPVGSGPFAVSDVKPGQGFTMTRHEEYFKGPATIQRHEFRRIDSVDTAAIALKSGEIDTFMFVSEPVWERLETDPTIQMMQAKNVWVNLWLLNTSVPALADARVRQAMTYAIDTASVIKTTTPHTSEVAANIIPDWIPEYSADVPKYPFDPRKAKELLSAAAATPTIKFLSSSAPSEAAQLQQSFLAAVGIKLDFEVVDRSAFNNRRVSGDFEISSRGLPGPSIEEVYFNYLHPDNAAPNGFNSARYKNPSVTALMEQGRSELDVAKRKSIWADVQKQVMTDLPYIPTGGGHLTWACRTVVKGMSINRMGGEINWYPLKLAKG